MNKLIGIWGASGFGREVMPLARQVYPDGKLVFVDDKSLTWAGAINPLWIVRKGSDEIDEIKPDWQFIGMVEKPKKYKQHELKLAKGDSIYLFSDGFQDQFGGEKGRKYLKGRFKKFILTVKDKDMKSQKTLFKKEFESWKGTLEQVDDVCIMGVKIT